MNDDKVVRVNRMTMRRISVRISPIFLASQVAYPGNLNLMSASRILEIIMLNHLTSVAIHSFKEFFPISWLSLTFYHYFLELANNHY